MTLFKRDSRVYLNVVKHLILIIILGVSIQLGYAQHIEPCATVDYVDHLEAKYPGFKHNVEQNYQRAVAQVKKYEQLHGKQKPVDTTYVIKVVFHVVYRLPTQNVASEHILEQLEIINACFSRLNADTINTRDIFKPVAGSARIRFELATEDPFGNPTTGINRKQTTMVTFNANGGATGQDWVKESFRGGVDAWDTKKYLNIWICNLAYSTGQRGLMGYAFPPTNADFWQSNSYTDEDKQGVVLHFETVGPNNPARLDSLLYTNEKTAVHEIGHFLGLRHTWGDGFGNGCAVDDYIDDTPVSSRASQGCPLGANTCGGDTFPDQVENFMDYGNVVCSNMFTKQQIGVMRYNLVNLRPGLAESEVTYEPGLDPAIQENVFYPVPINDHLNYVNSDVSGAEVRLEMYNYLGQKVLTQTQVKTDYEIQFNHIDLASGAYRIRIYSNDVKMIDASVIRLGY